MASLGKCLLRPSAHFIIRLYVFFMLSWMSSLYILDVNLFTKMLSANIFSYSVGWSFCFVNKMQMFCYQNANGIFHKTRKSNSKISMETQKSPNSQSNFQKEKQIKSYHTPWFQTTLQSYSYQNSMLIIAVQFLSCVWPFVTSRTAACLDTLSFTISRNFSNSCPSRRWCHPTISSSVIPWRRKWQLIPVFLPKKSHGQRSPAGCSPWGVTKSWAHLSMHEHSYALDLTWHSTYKCPGIKRPHVHTNTRHLCFPQLIW